MARGGLTARIRQRVPYWLPIAATIVLGTVAFVLVARRPDAPGTASAPVSSFSSSAQSPTPAPTASSTPTSAPQPPAARSRGVLPVPPVRRSGGTRRVAGKTFRLEAGEWVDAAFDAGALLPEMRLTTAFERRALLARVPALRTYAALGDRVTVLHRGTVYRFAVER